MKITSIFLLSALALLSFSGNARAESPGSEARCKTNIFGCPKLYKPVCGTDGFTYPNECLLCLENQKRQTSVRILKYEPC